MELITFRCPACKQVLRVAADKAGRKARCKCGVELTIPLVSENLQAAAAASAPPQRAAAVDEDDDEGAGGYGFAEEPTVATPAEEKPKEDARKSKFLEEEVERKRRLRASLRRAPLDQSTWEKIRIGILLVLVATYLFIGAFLLHKVMLVIGLFPMPSNYQYASLFTEVEREPLAAETDLDRAGLVIGVSVGHDNLQAGRLLVQISQLFILLQGLLAIAGCAICLVIPPRFGARGLAIVVLSLAGLNLLLQAVFKLLPVTGAMNYTMVPLVAPEIAMTTANIERLKPLHAFWSGAPLLEIIAAIVIQVCFFLEPVFFCLFLRAASQALREERLERKANALILMSLGTLFALVAYYLMAVTGTSEVLGWVLRAIYGIWVGFLLGTFGWYVVVLQWTRTLIASKLAEEEA